jgi:enduracididine beta-hydroxylase
VLRFELTETEVADILRVVDDLAPRYTTVEDERFHAEALVHAQELPRRLRQAIIDYRTGEASGSFVLSGFPVDDSVLGETPADWRNKPNPAATTRYDLMFFLVGSLLGEPVGWGTQQDGLLMHDVFPIKGFRDDQIGWGSEQPLVWHTEDAFHPLRADYLGLMCLRNPDGVETTAADVADVKLDEETRASLFEQRYFILPDDSHRPQAWAEDELADPRLVRLLSQSRDRVESALANPEPVAVLFGAEDDPYLCLDPHYMQGVQGEQEQAALDRIGTAIDEAMSGVVLVPGDVLFIDNYRMVHGRKPFKARYDGTDRWLRRLNITRDLRKSRHARLTAASRVIY